MFWTGDHPGELCLALLQVRIRWTVDKFRGGVEARGRETPIQAFFLAGKTDRQVTRILYPRDEQSSNLSVARWTDTLSYFQSPVLALAWIERLLTRRGTVLREGRVSQTYFLLPIVIFGIK